MADPTTTDAPGAVRSRHGLSLRTRVVAAMALLALVLVGAGVVVVRTTSTHLIAQVDRQLERASGPAGGPRPGGFVVEAPSAAGLSPGLSGTTGAAPSTSTDDQETTFNTLYLGVIAGDRVESRVLPTTDGTDVSAPDVDVATVVGSARTGQPVTVGAVDGGSRFRVLGHVDERSGDVMVVGLQLADVDAATQRLVLVVAATGLVVLGVMALITWWVLRLGVRPIKEMTSAASEIAAGDLSHRIPGAPPGTEAAELGDALNGMLADIQVAFEEREASQDRLRRFVADASHELRTPLSTIRGYAELQRTGALDDPADLDAAMRRVEAESMRMGNLVNDLLELARLDRGRRPRRESVALGDVARDAAADFATVHRDHPLAVDLQDATVVGDPDLLHQIVANLLANAALHTPPGTTVRLDLAPTTDRGADAVALRVGDDGPGMGADDAARAFERFHRADPSRTRASGGTGLGLSIVQAVAEAHGGRVSLRSAPGDGTEVTVVLPLSWDPDPATVAVR